MDWKEMFAPHILDRGKSYYRLGKVSILEQKAGIVEGRVSGDYDYHVKLELDDRNNVTRMMCNCPHALSGHNCKHMVATMYAWENQETSKASKYDHDNLEVINHSQFGTLLEYANHDILKSFVSEMTAKDVSLKNRFVRFVQSHFHHLDQDHFVRQIDIIIDEHKDRSGFIDYNQADKLGHEAINYLYGDIFQLDNLGQYDKLIDVILAFMAKMYYEETNNCDGEFNVFYSNCIEIIDKAIGQSHGTQKADIFKSLMKFVKKGECDHVETLVEDVLSKQYREEQFRQPLREYFGSLIEQSEKALQDGVYVDKSYNLDNYVVYYLKLDDLSYPSRKTEALIERYGYLPGVREYLVTDAILELDYHKAIDLLEHGLELDCKDSHLVSSHALALKELYLETGDAKAYRDMLVRILIEYSEGNLETFKEYKALFTADNWPQKRSELFEQLEAGPARAQLYFEEKMDEDLLHDVVATSGLGLVFKYESILVKMFPNQLVKKYGEEIEASSKYAGNRSDYQKLTYLLKRLSNLPGGKDTAMAIMDHWRGIYKLKRAFMDELNKLEREM
ncbi:MAG: hypothetical protein PHU33_13745 [Bacteroidales bacterium]|nr:hypothetical protein [Bacteroidales bacterium]